MLGSLGEVVTKPKKGGGFGVKDLRLWNNACCLKLIWLLFFQSGSIWVAWYKSEILQGSLSNLWIVKPNSKNSWLANKLIKMRGEVYLDQVVYWQWCLLSVLDR